MVLVCGLPWQPIMLSQANCLPAEFQLHIQHKDVMRMVNAQKKVKMSCQSIPFIHDTAFNIYIYMMLIQCVIHMHVDCFTRVHSPTQDRCVCVLGVKLLLLTTAVNAHRFRTNLFFGSRCKIFQGSNRLAGRLQLDPTRNVLLQFIAFHFPYCLTAQLIGVIGLTHAGSCL